MQNAFSVRKNHIIMCNDATIYYLHLGLLSVASQIGQQDTTDLRFLIGLAQEFNCTLQLDDISQFASGGIIIPSISEKLIRSINDEIVSGNANVFHHRQ